MGLIADRLAAARAAATASTGLVKDSGAAAASSSEPAKSSVVTGMMNTVTTRPVIAGAKLPAPEMVKPKVSKPDQVLFRAVRPNLSFFIGNERVSFTHGWLLTNKKDVIAYLRDTVNAKHLHVSEEKEEAKK